ncbi:MAG: hypothetical protein QOH97_2932 [Actinoplanes sp.]|jgi:uncharacterized protein YkwD|nr:hypothetical protein [Actinoplanes sp.]
MRSSILRRLAFLALIPAALVSVVVVATPAEAAVTSWQRLQSDVVSWTNHQRVKSGCKALSLNAGLTRAGRDHSAWMARTGTFSHIGSGGSAFDARIRTAGYRKPSAENIAMGYRTGADVVNAFMKSPGHRANILNCQSKTVGVGAVYSTNGTPYYTEDFGY